MMVFFFSLHPSGTCGPFRDYSDSYSYDIMSEAHFFGFFIFNTSWVVLLIIALLYVDAGETCLIYFLYNDFAEYRSTT